MDLREYGRVGLASGIYYSSFAKPLLSFAPINLLVQKPVFFIATCGSPRKNYFDEIKQLTKSRDCTDLGSYLCTGLDTYGPFKLVGGLKKRAHDIRGMSALRGPERDGDHPTEEEIQGAVNFYNGLGF